MAQFKYPRGPESRVPTLEVGEAVWSKDTDKLIVGGSSGNVEIAKQVDLNNTNENVSTTASKLAEKVYYDEITYEKFRDTATGTDYWVTTIPHLDKDSNLIPLKHGFPNDVINSETGETPRDFANRHATSFCSNASTADVGGNNLIYGVQIQDGVIKQDIGVNNSVGYTLGIKADNTLVTYPANTPASTILADGCMNALTSYFPIIVGGAMVDTTIWNPIGNSIVANPRNIIAQMPNKDIKFFTFEGRTSVNTGVTLQQASAILLTYGVSFAYNLDGGGSAQPVVRGSLLTVSDTLGGTDERKVWDFLYVKREATHTENYRLLEKDIGDVHKRILDVERDLVSSSDTSHELIKFAVVSDFNSVVVPIGAMKQFYGVNGSIANAPAVGSWMVQHYQLGTLTVIQEAIPYSNVGTVTSKRRTKDSSGVWSPWV